MNGSIVRLSRTRVTGETPEAAKATAGHLLGRGYSVTLAYWNRDDDSPDTVVSNYEQTLDVMKGMTAGSYLSLKAPSFEFDADLYRRVLDKAPVFGLPAALRFPGSRGGGPDARPDHPPHRRLRTRTSDSRCREDGSAASGTRRGRRSWGCPCAS